MFISQPEVAPFWGFESFAAPIQQLQKPCFPAQRLQCCNFLGGLLTGSPWTTLGVPLFLRLRVTGAKRGKRWSPYCSDIDVSVLLLGEAKGKLLRYFIEILVSQVFSMWLVRSLFAQRHVKMIRFFPSLTSLCVSSCNLSAHIDRIYLILLMNIMTWRVRHLSYNNFSAGEWKS